MKWFDPNVNEINRLSMQAHYFAYESESLVLKGNAKASLNYMKLNGLWKFFWVRDADQCPTDFFTTSYNDKGGQTCLF